MTEAHKEKYNQIIILGNGFDLACSLNSTYLDFFRWRLSQLNLQSLGEIFECDFSKIFNDNPDKILAGKKIALKILNKFSSDSNRLTSLIRTRIKFNTYLPMKNNLKSFNFWDLLFLLNDNANNNFNWWDVEAVMDDFLKKVMDNVDSSSEQRLPFLITKTFDNIKERQDFLKNQLNIFEDNFAKYISNQVSINKNFRSNAKNKLSFILNSQKNNNDNATVISFNYSLSAQDLLQTSPCKTINKWINIHGYAKYSNNNMYHPIFGIDSTSLNNEADFRNIFTKSYQVALNTIGKSSIELPRNVNCISFYGHSLAKADYSYFESLFDMYNLYSSNLHLHFYCGLYDVKNSSNKEAVIAKKKLQNNKIHQGLMTSIYKLINHYGASLAKNHGDNLFHRLLLEGRIKIIDDPGARK